jgi:hypothetical protein
VDRPEVPDAQGVETVEEALTWLAQHHGSTSYA